VDQRRREDGGSISSAGGEQKLAAGRNLPYSIFLSAAQRLVSLHFLAGELQRL